MNIYLPVCSSYGIFFLQPSDCQLPSKKLFIDLVKAFFNAAVFQRLNNLIIFDRILPLFSTDFVLFLPSPLSNYRSKTSVLPTTIFFASEALKLRKYLRNVFAMKKGGKHDIFLIIDSPSPLEASRSPFTPTLSTWLDGLSLSLKSLFKFIVDSYLAMRLDTWERKLAKNAWEIGAMGDYIAI